MAMLGNIIHDLHLLIIQAQQMQTLKLLNKKSFFRVADRLTHYKLVICPFLLNRMCCLSILLEAQGLVSSHHMIYYFLKGTSLLHFHIVLLLHFNSNVFFNFFSIKRCYQLKKLLTHHRSIAQVQCFQTQTFNLLGNFQLSILFLQSIMLIDQIPTRNFLWIIFQILFTQRFRISPYLFFFVQHLRMDYDLPYPILTLYQPFALFPFYIIQQFWVTLLKLIMRKFTVLAISSNFVKAIHIKLNSKEFTCRTKLEKLECLKQRGKINSQKFLMSLMRNEFPWGDQLTMDSCSWLLRI